MIIFQTISPSPTSIRQSGIYYAAVALLIMSGLMTVESISMRSFQALSLRSTTQDSAALRHDAAHDSSLREGAPRAAFLVRGYKRVTMEAHKARERLSRVWGGPWWLRDHCAPLGLLRPPTQLLYLSCLGQSFSLPPLHRLIVSPLAFALMCSSIGTRVFAFTARGDDWPNDHQIDELCSKDDLDPTHCGKASRFLRSWVLFRKAKVKRREINLKRAATMRLYSEWFRISCIVDYTLIGVCTFIAAGVTIVSPQAHKVQSDWMSLGLAAIFKIWSNLFWMSVPVEAEYIPNALSPAIDPRTQTSVAKRLAGIVPIVIDFFWTWRVVSFGSAMISLMGCNSATQDAESQDAESGLTDAKEAQGEETHRHRRKATSAVA